MEKENKPFWKRGNFIQRLSADDHNERMKTFHKKHEEDMKFNCKDCQKKISAHNKDWHNGLCDDCFDRVYFPEDAQIFETDLTKMKLHCGSRPILKENRSFKEFFLQTEVDLERLNKIVQEIEAKITCPQGGECCRILKSSLGKEHIDLFIKNAEICPIIFNVLENIKQEFLEDIYAFENPDD